MKKNKPKPGSSPMDAKKIGGKGDFGVPESDLTERAYTSENTKQSDPGNSHPRAGTTPRRESGVGADASGPGSSSGGDVDTDVVGVGTGRGIAESGPDEPYRGGPDEAEQTSPPPHKNKKAPPQHLNQPGRHESTVSRTRDVSTGSDAQGGDAATNPAARNDDSFSAEISTDDASGRNAK